MINIAASTANKIFQFIVWTPIFLFLFILTAHAASNSPIAYQLDIEGGIGPATADYISRGIVSANENRADFVLLRIDTPGGLDASMRTINQSILASKIPVVCYVGPSGAQAASAGTYILYACHVAAMAPGTNLGAATPVSISGGDIGTTEGTAMKNKVSNNAKAYIRSLAQLRGRDTTFAENAVTQGASISANDALAANLIDFIAASIPELSKMLNAYRIKSTNQVLRTDHLTIIQHAKDWRTTFLSIITDPSIAYVLLLLGAYGLFFEFAHPGFVLPGVVGAISLLLAMYALQMLPVSSVGLALIVLGILFMFAEAFMPSFGALGIGGVIAFFLGSIFLYDSEISTYRVAWPIIVAMTGLNLLIFTFLIGFAIRASRRKVVSGREELVNQTAIALDDFEERGQVQLLGEIWHAECKQAVHKGDLLTVVSISGLTLQVKKIDGNLN